MTIEFINELIKQRQSLIEKEEGIRLAIMSITEIIEKPYCSDGKVINEVSAVGKALKAKLDETKGGDVL
jgi:20S proteasome alpha/beta subunit